MNLQLTLAWRYLNGRKLRSFLTTLAILFGVLVIFGMNIILPTMLAAFQANMMAASGAVDATITSQSGGTFSPAVEDKLQGLAGIRAMDVYLDRTVNLPANFVDGDPAAPDRITAVALVGINPPDAQRLHVYQIQGDGRFLLGSDTTAAVITQSLADAWHLHLNDTFTLPSVNGIASLTVVGLLPPRTEPGNEQILVNLPEAQAVTGQAGQVNAIEIALNTTDEAKRTAILSEIKSMLGSTFSVGALQTGTELFAGIKMGQVAFNMFGALALFMGGFIIFNTFRTIVAERRRDIGMLRALGARRATIVGMILLEGLLQGILGSLAGLAFGYLLGAVIVRLAQAPLSTFVHLTLGAPVVSPTLIVTSIAIGIGITVLAGLLPARNASRVTPMDALRPSVAEVEYRRRADLGSILGTALIALAIAALVSKNTGLVTLGCLLFLVGLILVAPLLLRPITYLFGKLTTLLYARQGIGELAQGNLTRQPSRVVITASATMIGIAIIVALGGMTASLSGVMDSITRKNLGSDYLFMPPSVSVWSGDIGAGPDFVNRLQAIPGVGDISTLRFAASSAGNQPVSLMGINPETFPRVSGLEFQKGNASAYAALAAGRNMIINGAFMMATGAELGDTLDLVTPSGSQPYRIVAVATDLLNAKVTTAFISQANMALDFGRADDVFIQMNLKPGVSLASVDDQIRAAAANYPQFSVITGKAYIDQMMQLVKVLFSGMYFLLAFLALPSLIAMINTLAISVIERTREIGLLRAVGGTRKQISRMITAEALLLAAVGTAFGILSGMYLGYVIIQALSGVFPMTYAFPWVAVLTATAIGLIFGALAAIVPARQATRLQVVEALRYE